MKDKSTKYQTLTKGEMDVMKRLWTLGEAATVKELLETCDEPKPAYTTMATFMKILTAKGYVSEERREGTGKVLYYRPLITQEEYTRRVMDDVTSDFFGGSVSSLVNFFVREERISAEEVEQLLKLIER